MVERNERTVEAWSPDATLDHDQQDDHSLGGLEAGESLAIPEVGGDDASIDDVLYPLPGPDPAELYRHLLAPRSVVGSLDDRGPDWHLARLAERTNASFAEFQSAADPIATSTEAPYVSGFEGQAHLAEVEALIGSLPPVWALASSPRGLFPATPSPQHTTAAAFEAATAHGMQVGSPAAAAPVDAAADLFRAGPGTGDDVLYGMGSAETDANTQRSAAVTADGGRSEVDEAAAEPVLSSERLLIGGDDGDSGDKLGAITSGAPTGAIASKRPGGEDVTPPRFADVGEPSPEASLAIFTTGRRVEVAAPSSDSGSGPGNTTGPHDAVDDFAGAEARAAAVEPVTVSPVLPEAAPAPDERPDDARTAAPSVKAAPDTPERDAAGETAVVSDDPALSLSTTPPAGVGSVDEVDPTVALDPGPEGADDAGRWDASRDAPKEVPIGSAEEPDDAIDAEYPAPGPGVPTDVADAVLALLDPLPHAAREAADDAGGRPLIDDELLLPHPAEPLTAAGDDDHVGRHPAPPEHADWPDLGIDVLPDGDAL